MTSGERKLHLLISYLEIYFRCSVQVGTWSKEKKFDILGLGIDNFLLHKNTEQFFKKRNLYVYNLDNCLVLIKDIA